MWMEEHDADIWDLCDKKVELSRKIRPTSARQSRNPSMFKHSMLHGWMEVIGYCRLWRDTIVSKAKKESKLPYSLS